jgi:hypothetical protein
MATSTHSLLRETVTMKSPTTKIPNKSSKMIRWVVEMMMDLMEVGLERYAERNVEWNVDPFQRCSITP